ncbi:hypothetical protein [Acaryochloris sp. CCMEE 5410]|nr:hypothetical protein [Acaryochloris sp. CCMEE 5410]
MPPGIDIDANRDWDGLATIFHNRFPNSFVTLKEAEQWVEKERYR